MKMWTTLIEAIDPRDDMLKTWMGPEVPGETREDAERHLQQHGLGYCRIDMEFVEVIDSEGAENGLTPEEQLTFDFNLN